MTEMTTESTVPESPAPAQAETPVAPKATAVDQAVATGDVHAYRAARRAERAGTPLVPPAAPVEPPSEEAAQPAEAAPAATAPERQLSKRQQEINDRIREAVERATAEKDAEIARLKVSSTPAPPASASARPAAPTTTRPEPTEDEIGSKYATYGEFQKDLALWVWEQRDADARTQRETAERQSRQTERSRAFGERITKARTEDADRFGRLEPVLSQLPAPTSALEPGTAPVLANHLSEAVFTADDPLAMAEALTDAAAVARLQAATSLEEFYREIGRLEGRRQAAPTPPLQPLTAAPPPPTTLGRRVADPADPVQAAVQSGDIAAFRAARRSQRTATLR